MASHQRLCPNRVYFALFQLIVTSVFEAGVLSGTSAVQLHNENAAITKSSSRSRTEHRFTGQISSMRPSYEQWIGWEDDGPRSLLHDRHTDFAFQNMSAKLSCPDSIATDVQAIRLRRTMGPVLAQTPEQVLTLPNPNGSDPRSHDYLFIICPPWSGSTALLSLLSTSPRASNICSAGSWACEATWLFLDNGLISSKEKRWDPAFPSDWGQAVEMLGPYWNNQLPIFIEKDPPNAVKMSKIRSDLAAVGKHALFVVMTASPCFNEHFDSEPEDETELPMRDIVEQLEIAENGVPNSELVHIRYEELLRDPYQVSEQILNRIPQLESLDPAVYPLPRSMDERDLSVVDYILANAPFGHSQQLVDDHWRGYMDKYEHPHS